MRKLSIALLLIVSALPAFATGHCGNDPTKPDPKPFKCNGVENPPDLPMTLRQPFILVPQVEPPNPQLIKVEVAQPKVIAGHPMTGMVTIDHAVKYDIPVTLSIDPQTTATIPDRVIITRGLVSATFPIVTPASPDYDPIPKIVGTIYANYNATQKVEFTVLSTIPPTCDGHNVDYCTTAICYTCLFKEPGVPPQFAEKISKYKSDDLLVAGDRDFLVWRASEKPNCAVLDAYRKDIEKESDPYRKMQALAVLAFTARECTNQKQGEERFNEASALALQLNRRAESDALKKLSKKKTFHPKFDDVAIVSALSPVNDATTMTLGDSYIELSKNMRIGTQVERVFRDWMSQRLDWNPALHAAAPGSIVPWGEGLTVDAIMKIAPKVQVYPLSGTLVARRDGAWYAPDEQGVFRFNVLDDKIQYPTTHIDGNFGYIIDTHGISALVSQALEFNMQTVIGCGDSVGKAKAAFYLAQKGVNVINAADRYDYLLLGYQGPGMIIGNAPIHTYNGKPVYGHQPIQFSLNEPFIAEDTEQDYPIQYYDTPGKYFRRLSSMVNVQVYYAEVTGYNQLDKIFDAALHYGSTVVGVRIYTTEEDAALRKWLLENPKRRAILFHSGLYPYAQGLFADFPTQVTFGDLRPRFE